MLGAGTDLGAARVSIDTTTSGFEAMIGARAVIGGRTVLGAGAVSGKYTVREGWNDMLGAKECFAVYVTALGTDVEAGAGIEDILAGDGMVGAAKSFGESFGSAYSRIASGTIGAGILFSDITGS